MHRACEDIGVLTACPCDALKACSCRDMFIYPYPAACLVFNIEQNLALASTFLRSC